MLIMFLQKGGGGAQSQTETKTETRETVSRRESEGKKSALLPLQYLRWQADNC